MSVLNLVERLVGRRMMWKLGRRMYLHARREGDLEIETNGEAQLQTALARRSAAEARPLTIIDVGANYGQWSVSLLTALSAAKAPRASMTLFEPVPPIRAKLEKTMEGWREQADIRIEPMAMSDAPATATMVVTDPSAGTHHLKSELHNFEGNTIEVEVSTLDLYLARRDLGHVDFVKIDAEGYDPKVIGGMKALLARGGVDLVQFEYSIHFVRSRAFLADIFEMAGTAGYRVALLTRRGLEVHERWHPDLERFYASAMVMIRNGAPEYLPVRVAAYGADYTRG